MSQSRPGALILLAGLLACGGDKGTPPGDSSPVSADSSAPESTPEADPTQVTLSTAAPVSLLVSALDLDGQPIEGASVSIDGQSARVDEAGNARIDGVAAWTEAAVVRISAPGHADLIRRLDPLDGGAVRVSAALPALEDLGWFDASEAASVELVPFEIELPADAFATADGAVYEGRYHLSAQTWASHEDSADPDATFAASAPAPLLAPGLTDELDALESLGMLQVEVTDEAGSPLFLADGQRATLKVDVSDVSVAPTTCTDGDEWWWTLDEAQGLWVPAFELAICGEDQALEVEGDVARVVGKVSHFSFFNFDFRHTRGCGDVVVDLGANLLRGAEVEVSGPGYSTRVPADDGEVVLLAIPQGTATARLYLYDAEVDKQELTPGDWDSAEGACIGGALTLGGSVPSGPGLIARVRTGDCPATGGELVIEDSGGAEIARRDVNVPMIWVDDLAAGTYTARLRVDGVEVDRATALITAEQAEPTLIALEGGAALPPPGGCLPLPCEGEDCNSCLSLSVTEDGLPAVEFPVQWPETETSFLTDDDGGVCVDLADAADTHVTVALPDGTQGMGTLPRSASCGADTCLDLALEVGAGRTCPTGTHAWTAQSDWLGPTNPGTFDADQLLTPQPVTGGALALTVATTGTFWEESALLQGAFGCDADGLNCRFPGEVWSYESLSQSDVGLMVTSGLRLRAGRRDTAQAMGVSMDLGVPLSRWKRSQGQDATRLNMVFKGWEDGYGMPFTATAGTVSYEGQDAGALVFKLKDVSLVCADPLCGDASITLSGTLVAPRQTVASYPSGLGWLERRPQVGTWTHVTGSSSDVGYGPSFAQDDGAALSVCLPDDGPWMFVGNRRPGALRPYSALQVWGRSAPSLAGNTTDGGALLAQTDAIWVDRNVVVAELRRQGKDASKIDAQAAILGLAMRCEDGACEAVTEGEVLLSSPSLACPDHRVALGVEGRQGAFAIVGVDPLCATVDNPYILMLMDADGVEIPSFQQRVVPVAGGAMVVMREGLSRVYTDIDGDGYGEPLTARWGSLEEGGALTGDDCDDRDSDIHPGTAELPGDGVDQNCDGAETCYTDADEDGYATDDVLDSADADCLDAGEADAPGTDCDDRDDQAYPDAEEVCDGVDNNCDFYVDGDAIDASAWYADSDGDGYGDPDAVTIACDPPAGYTADSSDCEDGAGTAFPGGVEICDCLDNDCDGETDEGGTLTVVYDAAAEFSATDNPNGVWSYAGSRSLTSSSSPYPDASTSYGLDYWNDATATSAGGVTHNGTEDAIRVGSVTLDAGHLCFHPGSAGEYSHVLFTVPDADGTYTIAATFTGLDSEATTTDVHVSVEDTEELNDTIDGYGDEVSYASPEAHCLEAGATIDFAVGYGTIHDFQYDTTGLDIQISFVPADACE